MERFLFNRLELRKKRLEEHLREAGNLLGQCKAGVSVLEQEIIKWHLSLKQSIRNIQSDTDQYVARSNVDNDFLNIVLELQMKGEETLIELELILNLFAKNTVNKDVGTNNQPKMTVRLPKLELLKFCGDILKWTEFWDIFEANVHSQNIRPVEKLAYLLGSLEGKAKDAVEGLSITNDNYEVAVETLKARYGHKNKVIDSHYEALSKLKRSDGTAECCRRNLNEINKHLRVLTSLGENEENNHLRSLIMEKFPNKVLYELNLLTADNRSVSSIRSTLENIIGAMERANEQEELMGGSHASIAPSTSTTPSISTEALHTTTERTIFHQGKRVLNRPGKKRTRLLVSTNGHHGRGVLANRNDNYRERDMANRKRKAMSTVSTDKKRPRLSCIFCNGSHYNDNCTEVKSVVDRRSKLGDRCHLCFKLGHFAANCTTRKTCYYCKAKHNRALCPSRKQAGNAHASPGAIVTMTQCLNTKSFLQTAMAEVVHNNKIINCRLLLDSGSQRSYITTGLAKHLNLNTVNKDLLLIFTFGSQTPTEMVSPCTDIVIRTKRGIERSIHVNVVPHITDRIPKPDIPKNDLIDILADSSTEEVQGIDVLLGNDYYFSFVRNNRIQIDHDLFMVDTDFGWILSGRIEVENKGNENVLAVATYHQSSQGCTCYTEPDLPLRQSDIKFLWSLENIGITDSVKATREEQAVQHFNNTVNYDEGRYYVKWPWITYPPELPTNYGLAYGRLKGLLQRLDKSAMREYNEILMEQMNAGIIERVHIDKEVHSQSVPPIHYLGHHLVRQSGKRGRIVYDASARVKDQLSLNECMYRGPCMLQDLTALLLNFRIHKIGIVADVEKAFLQVGLQEEDRDVTRFLWIKDVTKPISNENILHLRFCRVPFGVIASPFLLSATIRYHIGRKDSELLRNVANKCYVDNLVTGTSTTKEACQLFTESKHAFEELSMNLRDWISNDESFTQTLPELCKGKETQGIKVLGLLWNKREDVLNLNANEELWAVTGLKKTTKREVLRTLASVYDPCGFVAPVLMPLKIFLQDLWRNNYKWDEPLPQELLLKWKSIRSNLQEVGRIRLPRYVTPNEKSGNELHCFTDAAKDSYAAVAYLRSEDGNKVKTSFLMSKSRVAPIEKEKKTKNKSEENQNRKLTTPQLELLGYVVGNRLLTYLRDNLEVPIARQYLWTDSLVVLNWIHSTKLLPPFVANRVEEIKRNVGLETCYVNTKDNPADIATRPELWTQKKSVWLRGPTFLSKRKDKWPEDRHLEYHQNLVSFSAVAEGLKAQSPGVPLDLDISDEPMPDEQSPAGALLELDNGDEPMPEERQVDSQVQEVRNLQQRYYPEELEGHETSLSRNLGLFKDVDGLLRCKGRMTHANWSYDMKYPVLLPRDCDFTEKVVREIHEQNYHVGPAHTLSLIRQQFWIPKGRPIVERILKKCPQCVKHGGGPYKLPPPPALPVERANYSTPFTYTGIDYFGPVYVDTQNGQQKRWVCLMTCLAVRAVHMEIVKDLTAEECVMALRRFTSARGIPLVIVSDNALYFKLSAEILTSKHFVKNKIRWRFIPQLAPWHGAFYERLVGLVKHCMKRTLEKRLLNDSQVHTVVKEIEAVINSRPLTRVGPELENVLRPCDFLSLGNCLNLEMSEDCIMKPTDTATRQSLLEGWKKGQNMLNQFKSMFINQYLTSLRERYTHSHKQPRVKSHKIPNLGDLVQIKGESKNRANWKVGRIVNLIKSPDEQHRVARVQVGDSIYTRSVGHLYPLELEESLSSQHDTIEIPKEDTSQRKVPDLSRDDPNAIQEQETPAETEQGTDSSEKQENSGIVPTICADEDREKSVEVSEQEALPPIQEDYDYTPSPMCEDRQIDTINNEVNHPPEEVVRRTAAIRAREKIAEWTRQLFTTL